jgi:hypothetical protein
MRFKMRAVRAVMYVIVVGAALWVVGLLSVIGNIYLSHAIPHGLSDWIVNIQIRNNYWPGQQPHSTLFYLVRFYSVTGILVCAGLLSGVYLKRTRQAGDQGTRL